MGEVAEECDFWGKLRSEGTGTVSSTDLDLPVLGLTIPPGLCISIV